MFTSDVDDLVANMAKLPMGTIIPWTPRPDADTSNNSDIPDHWQACDGSIIRDGPWAGRSTPDLNEQRRFLRGGPEKDVLMMEDDSIKIPQLTYQDYFYNNFLISTQEFKIDFHNRKRNYLNRK